MARMMSKMVKIISPKLNQDSKTMKSQAEARPVIKRMMIMRQILRINNRRGNKIKRRKAII